MGLVQSDNSYENGKKVWQALQEQMEEGRGFLSAIAASLLNFIGKYRSAGWFSSIGPPE
jgi:hypothetical protein